MRALSIFTFLLACILSSCTLIIDLKINPDDSGTYSYTIIYSDTIKSLMTANESGSEDLTSSILSDEMKKKLPEGITVNELIETDSSTTLQFDFKSLEDLNSLLKTTSEKSAYQNLTKKGKSKYTFVMSNNEESSESETAPGFMEEIDFLMNISFPNRIIKSVKKHQNGQLNAKENEYKMDIPITSLTKGEPIEVQFKVK